MKVVSNHQYWYWQYFGNFGNFRSKFFSFIPALLYFIPADNILQVLNGLI